MRYRIPDMRSGVFVLLTFKPQNSYKTGKDGIVTFDKTYWTAKILLELKVLQARHGS